MVSSIHRHGTLFEEILKTFLSTLGCRGEGGAWRGSGALVEDVIALPPSVHDQIPLALDPYNDHMVH